MAPNAALTAPARPREAALLAAMVTLALTATARPRIAHAPRAVGETDLLVLTVSVPALLAATAMGPRPLVTALTVLVDTTVTTPVTTVAVVPPAPHGEQHLAVGQRSPTAEVVDPAWVVAPLPVVATSETPVVTVVTPAT